MTLTAAGCDSSPTSQTNKNEEKTVSAKRKQSVVKYKKASEAPKNPKTAYFLFSIHMHGERKQGTNQGQSISNKVSGLNQMHIKMKRTSRYLNYLYRTQF